MNQHLLKEIKFAFKITFHALVAWIFAFPLTFLIPRNKNNTAVFSTGSFQGNAKYFFCFSLIQSNQSSNFCLLSADIELVRTINLKGGEAIVHPSLKSFLFLLRAGKIAMDMADWINHGGYPLTRGATRIQLWHGSPLKHIERDFFHDRMSCTSPIYRYLIMCYKSILGRYPTYDFVLSSSQFFTQSALESSFKSKVFLNSGYPRNDIFFNTVNIDDNPVFYVNTDTDLLENIKKLKHDNFKIILYAPTFRKDLKSPFDSLLELNELSKLAQKNNIVFVVKLHPFMHKHTTGISLQNIIMCNPTSDIYPLMRDIDVLITDYSSIYIDFLLLNKPIVFFAYDLHNYSSNDRSMYFDYSKMTPGIHCTTQSELHQALITIIANNGDDGHQSSRTNLQKLAHDFIDGNSNQRLLNHLGL